MTALEDARLLVDLVHENPDESNFAGPCDPDLIMEAERRLGLTFPPSYKYFVEELGTCDIAGYEFIGIFLQRGNKDIIMGSVTETLDARRDSNLPELYVVFYYDGMGGMFVMDTSRLDEENEAPIYVWQAGDSKPGDDLEYISPSFGTCALDMAIRGLNHV
jgi:hypothetical protein